MSLSRLYLRTRLDIFNVFLKYRRYTLIRSFPLTSVFPTSPSAIFNFYHLAFVNVPSYSVYLLLILLGSLSVPPRSIHLSQCRLLCPCVSYADVCVTVLDTSFISSSPSSFRLRRFGRLPSAIVQHARRTRVLNAILFRSRLRLLLLHLLSVYSLLPFFANILTFTFR
jgi:hypothetical protein